MSIAEEKFRTKTSFLLPFEKMHGLGNDFVIINNSHLDFQDKSFEQELCKKICDRHLGIGADGMIVIDNVKNSENAIKSWRYYNSDGSIGEMCGNGIRCAAKYIYEHGLSAEETEFKIETLAGDIGVSLLDDDMVKVDMGAPREINRNLSLQVSDASSEGDFTFNYDFVSMGNPHAIGFYEVDTGKLQNFSLNGPTIEFHSNFPNKTNVEFARKVSENVFELIVWERGCGFTQACGTGACATAVAAIEKGLALKDSNIEIRLPGGSLFIRWDSVTNSIFMTGPAKLSFIGYYNEER